ncbi:MAG TPA: T9SS type A sorting domain-containing protein, partial [Adhaeribacter sp.]|nr:T9SS type A sorting domain-containing protein [Adhaeribacter sp.]
GGQSTSQINGDKTMANKGYDDFWIVKLGVGPTGVKETETAFLVSIFPNPNNGKFNLVLDNVAAQMVEVTVVDLLGRIVVKQKNQIAGNQFSREITMPKIKGIYLLQLKFDQQYITRRIIIE